MTLYNVDKCEDQGFVIGIDATNLRGGGGTVTHLIEILRAANRRDHNIASLILWGNIEILSKIEDMDWLVKINPHLSEGNLFQRSYWQHFCLSRAARDLGCDMLFAPGGTYTGDFHPIVTMSRNMLPFEWNELRRFGWSLMTFKFLLLRWTQIRTFRKADGVIFLTRYAKVAVESATNEIQGSVSVIGHGISNRFNIIPRRQKAITEFSKANPLRILYVSTINQYKHQWQVINAIGILRATQGWPLVLDLVGAANYQPAMDRLKASMRYHDPKGEWVLYHGSVSYNQLHSYYANADIGVFASSCENLPNILLETMASGLPVACSNRGPMPEILGEDGLYFDPEDAFDIANCLAVLIDQPSLRDELAHRSHSRSLDFTWEKCAFQTFQFLIETLLQYRSAKRNIRNI